ncbi:ABC transporter permease [Allonocardiopsis opalescens]|uniref:Peptide/nickel transport system permease protein n=1 Tax=Allonocardiopsis opalescens TaxID=1144618 RepID=A0A2T0PVF0_9ACTN|nr:ABC transporter permease [Allonocardiopsis opalescens]PRX95516.1 peptide/nickel transport system permease protein [Allonocardiopsis opalescens]
MAKFLLRRLANYVLLVFVATSFAYVLAATSLDARTYFESQTPRPDPAAVEMILTERNLNDNDPLAERYVRWLGGVVTGDLGLTVQGTSVNDDVQRRIGVTLRLIVLGAVIGSVSGVAIGAYAAVKQYKIFDRVSTVTAFVLLSIPTVVLAVILQIGAVMINDLLGMRLLLYSGEYSAGLQADWWGTLVDRLQHLILPTLSLALGQLAAYMRYQRNMMLDVLDADFVRTAMAKGLTRRVAMRRHALRTALIPVVTYFAFTFGVLMAGAIFTETIFAWHGMGELLVHSIAGNDINSVVAVAGFSAVCVLLAALASDVAYAWLDPRVRVS